LALTGGETSGGELHSVDYSEDDEVSASVWDDELTEIRDAFQRRIEDHSLFLGDQVAGKPVQPVHDDAFGVAVSEKCERVGEAGSCIESVRA
jgi:hypothetical protein